MEFDIGDILENPAFYILCGVGMGAFIIMMMVLKGMGNGDIMPLWVKIVTIISIPIGSALFSGWASGD